jgi:hypothetical protein
MTLGFLWGIFIEFTAFCVLVITVLIIRDKRRKKVITDQQAMITRLVKDRKALAEFREGKEARKHMPREAYINWLCEKAEEL